MDLSQLTNDMILLFLLMLIRITGMLIGTPFFGQAGVPIQVQAAMAMVTALIFYPVYLTHAHVPASNAWEFTWLAGQEFVIGMLIGFVASMAFATVQFAGNHVTTLVGLNAAQMMDPLSNSESPVLSQFYFILAITLFMSLDMHHSMLIAIGKSFDLLPVAGGIGKVGTLVGRFMALAGDMFSMSMLLILPIMGTMLVFEIALAFMSKMMPQMNIFMVMTPLKIIIGIVLMIVTMPFTMKLLVQLYAELARHMFILYKTAA